MVTPSVIRGSVHGWGRWSGTLKMGMHPTWGPWGLVGAVSVRSGLIGNFAEGYAHDIGR